jgi:excisionase family DNA binding protein
VEKLYTVKEIAQVTGLNINTVWNYVKAGKIKSLKVGDRRIRVWESDFKEWLDQGARGKGQPA